MLFSVQSSNGCVEYVLKSYYFSMFWYYEEELKLSPQPKEKSFVYVFI